MDSLEDSRKDCKGKVQSSISVPVQSAEPVKILLPSLFQIKCFRSLGYAVIDFSK